MNKIYKLVWSKVQNMYIAVCEFAKSRSRYIKRGEAVLRIAAITVLFFPGVSLLLDIPTAYALAPTVSTLTWSQYNAQYRYYDLNMRTGDADSGWDDTHIAINNETGHIAVVTVRTGTGYVNPNESSIITINDLGTSSLSIDEIFSNLTAGNGITISDKTISAKAGTNVTVNSNGISVTGNGSVASGNTGLISGGTLYSELRPTDNGNYVTKTNTTAANIKALDTQTKTNTDAIAAEVTNRTTAVSNEATTRANADTALSNRIGTLTANGSYITTTNSAAANLKALDDKIGTAASANGTYTKTGNTVNANLKALDTQTKSNTDAIGNLTNNTAAKDASNVDAQTWANKLGTGSVSATDTKLVTGQTVYNALHNTNTELEVKSATLSDFLTVGGDTTLQGNLAVAGTSNLHDTNVNGDLGVTGDGNIGGNLGVAGTSDFAGDVTMQQNLAVTGNSQIGGNETIGGDLIVDGNTTLRDLLTLLGDADMQGNLDVAGTSNLHGDTTIDQNLNVAGNSQIGGNETIGGDLIVDGNTTLRDLLTLLGDADLQGNLDVAGTSNLHDTNVTGGLGVTGDGNIGGNLAVAGTSDFAGDVAMQQNLAVAGNADVTGNGNIGGDLAVAGTSNLHDTNVNGTLDVTGPSNFHNNVAMDRNLAVAGDTRMQGNADIGRDLHVAGDASIDQDLSVGGTARFGQAIWNEGQEHQVEINNTGIRVGLNSTHMDAHGIYAGGHNWNDARAAMHEDGRIKGIYGYLERDLQVGGDAMVGGTLTADRAVIGGKDVTGEFRRLDDKIGKVGAGAAALAGLQYNAFEPGSKFSMAIGVGNYKGSTATAIGGQYHFNRNVSMNIAGTIGNGENMVSAGLTFNFGTPKTQYQKDNDALRAENNKLNKRLNAIEKKLQSLSLITDKRAGFPDVEKSHWANKAVETLHGNGFIKGYEDGNFKGNRQMTRYEYAEMLYNALSRGAKVDQAQLEEYAPELHKVNAERVRGKGRKITEPKISTATVQQDADTQAFGQAYNANHPR